MQPCLRLFSWNSQKLKIIMSGYLTPNFTQIENKGGNNNNNSFYLLQWGCHPVAVIILHVHKNKITRKFKSWGLHEKHVIAIMDRNSYCPSVKYSLHRADTKRTNNKWIFVDIRRVLVTMDEENRTSHLHPSVQYACDSTHLYGTDSCWVDYSRDILHRILTLSEEKLK